MCVGMSVYSHICRLDSVSVCKCVGVYELHVDVCTIASKVRVEMCL